MGGALDPADPALTLRAARVRVQVSTWAGAGVHPNYPCKHPDKSGMMAHDVTQIYHTMS